MALRASVIPIDDVVPAPVAARAGARRTASSSANALLTSRLDCFTCSQVRAPTEWPAGPAELDRLTGVPNRSYLLAHLPQAIQRAARDGRQLPVFFLDLDRFRCVNDSYGYRTGDQLLRAVTQSLRAVLQHDDLLVRMGGDEFAIVLESVSDEHDLNETAARILATLSQPFMVNGRSICTSASVGVSVFPRDGGNAATVLRHADAALYHAKDRGRDNWQIFRPAMGRSVKQRATVESRLRQAIQEQQLEVFYQPVVDIDSLEVVALEALLRWKHPVEGWIPPDRFIGIAEETGLIVPIGDFVLGRVLQDINRWRHEGCLPVPVAINVSAVQLQRGDFCERVVAATRAAGLEPGLLQVELTESALFEHRGRDGDCNESAVERLRSLGVHIAIDDFGTGYSSLSYLKRWQVDSLKIDRSFVRDLATEPRDLAILAAICAMARQLELPVVAEGVEDWRQLRKLRELGCTRVQGYLFSKAVPASDCGQYLRGDPLTVHSHGAAQQEETHVAQALRG